MTKVLIGSPIHQNPNILKEFLTSLKGLEKDDLIVEYYFIDDNKDEESKAVLKAFKDEVKGTRIIDSTYDSQYICTQVTHIWSNDLVSKVANFKNSIIEVARKENFDYLFFIDSDIVLHPKTLKRLISSNKEIVANIFWTRWVPGASELPQVWMKDVYTLYDSEPGVVLNQEQINQKTDEFLKMLRAPGTYKVGGLGACTLISKSALEKPISFDPIYNVSFWGEDRHFCIRAIVLGIDLYVDTFYPAYHIYRLTDLGGINNFKKSCLGQ